jgi:hypothetical protein
MPGKSTTIHKRTILASLISPVAILLIPIMGSLFVLHTDPETIGDAMDDAPMRSAGVFLFVLAPIAYPVLVVVLFLASWFLERLRLLSKRSVAVLVVLSSVIIGMYLGPQSPFGVKDQLIGVGVFSLLFAVCLGFGAAIWWIIARPRHNKSIKATGNSPVAF